MMDLGVFDYRYHLVESDIIYQEVQHQCIPKVVLSVFNVEN